MRQRSTSFVLRALPLCRRFARRESPRCCSGPPRQRSVRVKRACTYKSRTWEWKGRGSNNPWRKLFSPVDDSLRWFIESCWQKGVSGVAESRLITHFTRLGFSFLKSVSEAIQRTFYPDVENELVVEYGITNPNPTDKTFVDPLREWEPTPVTYYKDSFGKRVYLQARGATGLAIAMEFRDQYDESTKGDDDHDHYEYYEEQDTRANASAHNPRHTLIEPSANNRPTSKSDVPQP